MAVMASSGLPGFANFVSEVMVFIGAWSQGSTLFRIATICAVWGIVVTATSSGAGFDAGAEGWVQVTEAARDRARHSVDVAVGPLARARRLGEVDEGEG